MSIQNRKARFDYHVVRTENAGLMLTGSEVKQLRDGKASLVDSYCYFVGNELFVKNFLINETKTAFSHDPKRDKKLLLKKTELNKLKKELEKDKGMTIVPLSVYSNNNYLFKMEIGLCKGKKDYDKKKSIMERETLRDSLKDSQY
jgi:SsrA-binding protein